MKGSLLKCCKQNKVLMDCGVVTGPLIGPAGGLALSLAKCHSSHLTVR